MKRRGHILLCTALLVVLPLVACRRTFTDTGRKSPELVVSLYIPGASMTRAETGMVNALSDELRITSLDIWAFLSEGGTLVSYKHFDSDLNDTGIPNFTITRFGMPLTDDTFALLTAEERPKVDVYAVANIASSVSFAPNEKTPRDALDQIVIDCIGGVSPLTMSVSSLGLPFSGVLKNADVTGGYPVLNITTLKLTRAVSKMRFVFCQQGIAANGDTPGVPANKYCQIRGLSFDGTQNGYDCQIGASERLFTTQAFDLGDQPSYTPLSASLAGQGSAPLISNSELAIVEEPEDLYFRSAGNLTETAEHYENRLDAAVKRDSQVGPIYFCETDKTISGTITYRTEAKGPDQTAHFSMDAGDVFSRNHTWIVYACFVEETMKLQIKVSVLDWDWQSYQFDFTSGSVNVVRRFTVFETHPSTFRKEEANGFYDIRFWHTVEGVEGENVVKGDIIISTPVGATLHVLPIPPQGGITDAILVDTDPSPAIIYPNYAHMENGRIEDCIIGITIKANKDKYSAQQLEGQYIDLHFSVETQDGQFIDLGSESIDYYRFILDSNWKPNS